MRDNKKKGAIQIVAFIGVVILVLLIIATLVVACLNFEGSDRIFFGLVGLDICVPVVLWMYLYLYKIAKRHDSSIGEDTRKKEDEEK